MVAPLPETPEQFRATLADLGLTMARLSRILAAWGDQRSEAVIRRWLQRMADGKAPVADYVRVVLGILRDFREGRDLHERIAALAKQAWRR